MTELSNQISPKIFETAYLKDTQVPMDNVNLVFYPFNIGSLKIKSGKIIACDPIVMKDGIAFTQTFPIGEFPVQLSIAKIENDERVAFIRILFSNQQVSKWEVALLPEQEPIPLKGEEYYGYNVDGGTGLFIDEQTNKYFNENYNSNWENVFVQQMNKNYRNTWSYLFYEFEEQNFVSFSTGYGDGTYATFIGFDEKGNVCQLLTDFGFVNWRTKF